MALGATLGTMIDKISGNVKRPDNTYIGEDGLMRCSICKGKVQTKINVFGEDRIVGCICECRKKEIEAEEQERHRQEFERRRVKCFAESKMASWTFAADDRKTPKISDAMQRYVDNFPEFRKDGKGLLLYGTVGTGKTYFAACVANGLIDKGNRVLMTNFARLTNQIQGMFEGKQEFIDSLNRYDLLILDDLGAERTTEFMREMVFNIIDSRYRSGLPFIITTNLTIDEIKKPQDISCSRIYDRILERCFPIEVSGGSRRRQNVRDTFTDVKNKLGL